ncbi:PEP/pyruvate-binding domain-containing protein [Candidatus Pelagibacter sp. Uisw_130]|uniref:PEP/pyruvate-binding domain-containing protein n=1 Tax=Candidatus Pelagibacter sp. Uisw_130 TaxID=3230989 RepID=UPI0039ED8F99
MALFKSKAQTLSALKLKNAKIPKFIFFNVGSYKKRKNFFINTIMNKFNNKIAIRSSSLNEDNYKTSNAGKYQSFLNIHALDFKTIEEKIDLVISSYKKDKKIKKNEILVQEMTTNIKFSGVLTNVNKENCAPYILINYSEGKQTDVVTSGKKNTKNFVFYKYSTNKPTEKFLKKLIDLTFELESMSKAKFLDLEFAVDKRNNIFLLQLRPLVIKKSKVKQPIQNINKMLTRLEKKIEKLQNPHHDLEGTSTAFGVMPDWNPAEMIGLKPKALSLSLYQELITDKVWSEQRSNYGFRNISSNQLMVIFFGIPYIDLRVDFNSWIPRKLENKITSKLINFYMNKFKKNIYLHDKIEFGIVYTCFTADTNQKIKNDLKNNFSAKEIKKIIKSLKNINQIAINNFKIDKNKISILKTNLNKIKKSGMYNIEKIYWLIEDCKRYGTLPFAGLARCAFISRDILNSFVNTKILTKKELESFLKSIKTISTEINSNVNKISPKKFKTRYGHIRPNTYDIESKNYAENYKNYFNLSSFSSEINKSVFKFTTKQKNKINKFIKDSELNINFNDLINFIRESTQQREYSKFVFTKNIDYIFKHLKLLGRRINIKNQDLAFINIKTIKDLYYNLSNHNIQDKLKSEIKINKKDYKENKFIKLPEVITNKNDIYFFKETENKINFIGSDKISEDIVILNKNNKIDLKNKIVVIENADPGYDYIFSHKIKGLITKFGGINSHMSIRCNELNLPAAIGIGEKKYKEIINSKKILLDCENNMLNIIQ